MLFRSSFEEDGWLFSGRCLRMRCYNDVIPKYLYYYFSLNSVKEYIRGIAVGATMPSLNTKLLSETQVVFPPIHEQKVISRILSAIDDKIELNNKINDNLADYPDTSETSISPDISLGSKPSLVAERTEFPFEFSKIAA